MNKLLTRLFFVLILFVVAPGLSAQEIKRPEIWGIAKMTFLVSKFDLARDFYGRFLGFSEAFSYHSEGGKIISFKVNDRQFLEFVEDPFAKEKRRMVSVSLETENVEQMRQYLKAQGLKVPEKTTIDGAGNEVFTLADPSGNHIEFIRYGDKGLHKKSEGKYLSKNRISERIHHVGLHTETIVDDDLFFAGILQFEEIIRYPEDKTLPPMLLYFGMGDCTENVEHYYESDPDFCHPCFLVNDMQEAIYLLKGRRVNEDLGKPGIGMSRRWIMHIKDPDNNMVEFTEAHCVK